MMKFDELLERIGEFGPYQKRIFVLASLVLIPSSFMTFSPVFLLDIPDYRCALPSYKNDTYSIQSVHHQHLINISIPLVVDSQGEATYSKCSLYNRTNILPGDNSTYDCAAWVYDTSVIQTSGVTDFNMVCGKEVLRSLSNMVMHAAGFPGMFIFGTISDSFGRKKALLLGIFLNVATSVAAAASPTYEVYVITAFFSNINGLFMVAFVIVMEVVGPSKRTFVGIVMEFFWVTGLFLLTGAAYLVRQWRQLRLFLGIPPVIFLTYWWLIPESPRWLVSKGRIDEAYDTLRKIAKSNSVDFSDTLRNVRPDEKVKTVPFWKLLTNPVLLLRTVIMLFNWFSVSIVYYGVTLNVGNLNGDIYLNFFLSSVMELVAYLGTMFFLNRAGRKTLTCATQLIGGLTCLGTIFPVLYGDSSTYWTLVALSLVGKLCASAAYAILYIFAAELFPTVVRQSGLAMCSLLAETGGMVGPYMADLGILVKGSLSDALPLIVFGALTITAGIAACILPETRNQILPETLEDAIKLKKPRKNIYEAASPTRTSDPAADFDFEQGNKLDTHSL